MGGSFRWNSTSLKLQNYLPNFANLDTYILLYEDYSS